MTYTHSQVNDWLADAVTKVSAIDSATNWVSIGNGWWNIQDGEGKLLGWVEANICCKMGIVIFKYRKDRTYFSVADIPSIKVNAMELDRPDEFQKLVDFDANIAAAYAIGVPEEHVHDT